MQRMISEHTKLRGCSTPFAPSNHPSLTTPAQEWAYLVQGVPCPAENMHHNRRLVPIPDLMTLPTTRTAGLRECEVIALALYTGPMVRSRFPPLSSNPFPSPPAFPST